jgi:ABC-2 type transport system permease protein
MQNAARNRLGALIQKELIQILRDRMLVFFAIVGPALQLYLMGNAVGSDITGLVVAVIDQDRSVLSREIITALDNTRELDVALFPNSLAEGRQLMDDGEITGLVIIPPDFEAQTQTGIDAPQIQVILDGTQIVTAVRALGAAQSAVDSLGRDVVVTRAGGILPGGIELAAEALYNRSLDHVPHSVTAQFAFVTFQITALVSVMGIVRERELGTLEMLSITPLQRLEIIAGKAITPLLIGTLDFFVMYGVTRIVFGVENRGSFPLLVVLTLLYLVSETGFSLMISTVTRNQQQAVTAVFIWAMLCITLSGYMVPVERLPGVLRAFSTIIPLRHYLAIVRGIILKGAGVRALWSHILALVGLAIGVIFLTRRTLTRVIE